MRKSILVALAVALVVALGATAAGVGSEGQPAAKATAQITDIAVVNSTTGGASSSGWGDEPVLAQTIKTGNQKDLFIDVSLQCGLYTFTHVKSKGKEQDTSSAEATIVLKVVVDEEMAFPGEVVFCNRAQEMSAWFAGYLDDVDGLTEEELELILDTMSANSFNFIVDDLSAGVHTVEVWAKVDTDADHDLGSAEARGTIGYGSVTIEEVRMIQDEDAILD
jgi:hypothetical protein